MTKEQEAQQAQTIAEAKERIQWDANCRHVLTYTAKRNEFAVLKRRAKKFQRIIDSQAQKLKEQAETIATNAAYAIELQGKIAEQAKRIAELENGYDEEPLLPAFNETQAFYYYSARYGCKICKGDRLFSSEGYRFHLKHKHGVKVKGNTWREKGEWLRNYQSLTIEATDSKEAAR